MKTARGDHSAFRERAKQNHRRQGFFLEIFGFLAAGEAIDALWNASTDF
jgi:hypothetical protein